MRNDDMRNLGYLKHIVEHCQEILDDVAFFGNDEQTFFKNGTYRRAIGMGILQVGELAKGLSRNQEFCDAYNQFDWEKMASVRDLYAHSYWKTDKSNTWEIVKDAIPALYKYAQEIVKTLELERSMDFKEHNVSDMAEVQSAESKASLVQGLDKSADGSTSVEGRDIGYEEEGYVAAADQVKYESQQARSADNAAQNQAALENIRVGQRVTFRPYKSEVELTGNVIAVDSECVTLRCGKQEIGAKRACGAFVSAPPLTPEQTPEYAMTQANRLMGAGSKVYFAQSEGIYTGMIIGKTPSYAIQKVNKDTAILHRLKDLATKDKDESLIQEGQDISIVKNENGISLCERTFLQSEKEKVREQQKSRGGRSR
jgi:uncharacterized protein with HEPN domain